MRFLVAAMVLLGLVRPAEAHLGTENNTEVRVYSDNMRVVLRTSIPFAWSLLGESAPVMADEAGQAIAKPLLVAAAPGLISVSAGGKPMAAVHADCVFEIENDVAFILNFKRPAEWPVVVKAEFFNRQNLETGKIVVFDYTASRFSRDMEPVAQKSIDHANPSLTFTLAAPVAAPAVPEPVVVKVVAPASPAGGITGKVVGILLLLLAAGGLGVLVRRRLRMTGKGGNPFEG
mgnify:CR=1 FL=1